MNRGVTIQDFEVWRGKILASFRQRQRRYVKETSPRQRHAQLQSAPGKLDSRAEKRKAYFQRYTFLVADKSRGNFFMACNNLYKMVCTFALKNADDYERVMASEAQITTEIQTCPACCTGNTLAFLEVDYPTSICSQSPIKSH